MAELLLFLNVLLPLMGGVVMLVFLRGEDRHRLIIVSSIIVALSLILTVFTIMMHAPPNTSCMSWLASAGPMCVTFEPSSLTLILASSFPLLLIILTKNNTINSAVEFGLLLIAFSMMQVALVSDHFMLRYIALDFVGLCITAAALLLTSPDEKQWNNTKQVFINLRIGDLTLLVAIFLMFTISNSFDITKNFDEASQGGSDIQMILTACLLTGAWIKMAIWPLNQWRTATDTVKRSTRAWLLDICAPLLGVYLLYRSVPLLEMQQSSLFPVALVIGYSAVISFMAQDALRDQLQLMQRMGFQFTSICLVLAGFWIDQKGMWTFMLLWILLRVIYLIWHEFESSRESSDTMLREIEGIHYFLSQGLCFLIIWRITKQSHASDFVSIILWGFWWIHAIDSGMKVSKQLHFPGKDECSNIRVSATNKIFRILASGLFILAAGVELAGRAASALKGGGYSIFTGHMHPLSIPLLDRNFLIGLFAGGMVLMLVQQLLRLTAIYHRIRHRISAVAKRSRNGGERSLSDPLDFYEQIKLIVQKIAEFMYQFFERESAEKVGEGLSGVFKFLFRTVESFTSGNLWNRTLEGVVKSSYYLGQMHHGILRFNMIWLLAFIIGVSVFVWVWNMNGWV